jgi:phosphoglycolate phosphatase
MTVSTHGSLPFSRRFAAADSPVRGHEFADPRRRADLVPIARARAAARISLQFTPDTTLIIGDTPADVTAARDGKARIIAAATGSYSTAELADAGAGTVLADLSDTPEFLAAVKASRPPR